MTANAHCRVRSVTLKAGGAKLRVLRGGVDSDKLRASLLEDVTTMCDGAGRHLRGYMLAVYDVDGAFNVAYQIDGRVLRVHEAGGAFSRAFERAMCRPGGA